MEYYKLLYDEEGKSLDGTYNELRKAFYKDMTQDDKYDLYILDNNKKIYIKSFEELGENFFPSTVADRYFRNQELGKREYIVIENNKNHEKIFSIKRYEVYPYKKMVNTTYSGSASIVVQFKCKLEKIK